jgi:inosine-uridine nucleoside N-ribohydrolase
MSIPVLLDCDPGHDDAIAILLALASPEVELRGITTVAGNQTLEKTTRNALVVLELAGRADVPVCAGAAKPLVRDLRTAPRVHGESGLDGPDVADPAARALEQDASAFLAERLAPGVVLVATGPLTNVATLLAERPDARPERLVWMGGAIAEGNVTPAAEFNAFVDPEAATRVFASGVDVTMVGLDVTHRALLTAAHAERLRAAGRVGAFVAELHSFFSAFHRERYGWEGAPIHDAMAVGHVIDPTLLETVHVNVEVETRSAFCDGRTVVDRWAATDRPPNAHVAVDVDADRFLELLSSRLESLG